MRTPEAEVEIDEALIDRLVRSQFPRLAGTVRIVANGWDNVVARLGEGHQVRIPRRAVAVELIRNEATWLPRLAPSLPVPVPTPIAVGEPGDGFPWPWTIARWLPGIPLTAVPTRERRGVAVDLARAHRALHVPAPADAPRNPVRGVPLADRWATTLERIESGYVPHLGLLSGAMRAALSAPVHPGAPQWIHGDPQPGNVLATDAGDARLAGLIDFGDLAAGDPATDMAIAWTALDADARAAYRAELAPDDAAWARARGWAVVIASALAMHSDDNPEHEAIAEHTAEQLIL